MLYPHPGQNNRIEAAGKFTIPGPKDDFVITVDEPVGVSRIKAVVTSRPLNLSGLAPNLPTQYQSQAEQGKPSQEQGKPKQEQGKPAQEQGKPKQEQVKPKQEQGKPSQGTPKQEQTQAKPNLQLQKFLWPPSQKQQH